VVVLEKQSLPPIPNRPLTFASNAEYAAGFLLEKYIANFELKMGATFQVPIGNNKTCDFHVRGIFIEYHPSNLNYEFDNRQALRQLWEALKRVEQPLKSEIVGAIADELHEKYYRRRRFLITLHAGKDSELIVCRNSRDLYRNVIRRLADNPPREKEFVREFESLARRQ
jgi:hypothetical protein